MKFDELYSELCEEDITLTEEELEDCIEFNQ